MLGRNVQTQVTCHNMNLSVNMVNSTDEGTTALDNLQNSEEEVLHSLLQLENRSPFNDHAPNTQLLPADLSKKRSHDGGKTNCTQNQKLNIL